MMGERVSGFVVTLAADARADDVDATVGALRMIRGVIAVEPVTTTPIELLARARANETWRQRLRALLRDEMRRDDW